MSDEYERLQREISDGEKALEECHNEIRRLRSVIRELQEQRCFSVPLSDGNCLRASVNPDPDYREVIVGIVKRDTDDWIQDLCVVREGYRYDKDGNILPKNGLYEVLVYGDPYTEDYTEVVGIPLYGSEG